MRKITQKRVRLRKTRKITYTFFALKNCETTRTRRKYNDVQTAKLQKREQLELTLKNTAKKFAVLDREMCLSKL